MQEAYCKTVLFAVRPRSIVHKVQERCGRWRCHADAHAACLAHLCTVRNWGASKVETALCTTVDGTRGQGQQSGGTSTCQQESVSERACKKYL